MTEKIEQIRAGKLAIMNDLNNPELMAKVLRYVWPEDNDGEGSDFNQPFYFKHPIFNNKWAHDDENQLHTVPASEILAWMESRKTGIELIAEERKRQIEIEGWTAEHDAKHTDDSIACAAACYAFPQKHRPMHGGIPFGWKWAKLWWKPTPENRIKELVKAGALIAAEIDRLNRTNQPPKQD